MRNKTFFKIPLLVLTLSLLFGSFYQNTTANASIREIPINTELNTQSESAINNSNLKISGLDSIDLDENESLRIPLVLQSNNNDQLINLNYIFEGSVGYVELNEMSGRVGYKVVMYIPADSFIGNIFITDLTSGLSSGFNPVSTFSGSVSYRKYVGHQYGASLDGSAYLAGKRVANSVPNYITWTAK